MFASAAPSPPPVYVVLEQAGQTGPDLWTILTSIAPFVVSIVALGGVIWSSLHSSRTTIKAENRRAEASIEAEDRRAKAALEADERRHAQALAADAAQRRLAMRHDLYTLVEEANKPLRQACLRIAHVGTKVDRDREWGGLISDLGPLVSNLRRLRGQISLYGSQAVSGAMDNLWLDAIGVEVRYSQIDHPGANYQEIAESVLHYARSAAERSDTLRRLMRHELGVDD